MGARWGAVRTYCKLLIYDERVSQHVPALQAALPVVAALLTEFAASE